MRSLPMGDRCFGAVVVKRMRKRKASSVEQLCGKCSPVPKKFRGQTED